MRQAGRKRKEFGEDLETICFVEDFPTQLGDDEVLEFSASLEEMARNSQAGCRFCPKSRGIHWHSHLHHRRADQLSMHV